MGVAPPPSVPPACSSACSRTCAPSTAARGAWPPGELSFSIRRTREFEREPLRVLLRCHERFGPIFTIRLLYAPIVFALGPEANSIRQMPRSCRAVACR